MVTGASQAPIHRMSWAAIVMAGFAGVLSLYGSMVAEKHIADSPLRQARGSAGLPAKPDSRLGRLVSRAESSVFGDDIDRKMLAMTEQSKVANYTVQLVAFALPFALGIAAALTGGWAMKAVEASRGRYRGNTLAFFAMMIGGLAAVVSGCMLISFYVWPLIPAYGA